LKRGQFIAKGILQCNKKIGVKIPEAGGWLILISAMFDTQASCETSRWQRSTYPTRQPYSANLVGATITVR